MVVAVRAPLRPWSSRHRPRHPMFLRQEAANTVVFAARCPSRPWSSQPRPCQGHGLRRQGAAKTMVFAARGPPRPRSSRPGGCQDHGLRSHRAGKTTRAVSTTWYSRLGLTQPTIIQLPMLPSLALVPHINTTTSNCAGVCVLSRQRLRDAIPAALWRAC